MSLEEAVLLTAGDLISENGENPEYDRGIVEMTCDLLGFSHGQRDDIEARIRDMRVPL